MRKKRVFVTDELFAQVKRTLGTGAFNKAEIARMFNISSTQVTYIERSSNLQEMKAIQRATLELSRKRRQEREAKETEAKEAYEKATKEVEEEEVHPAPIQIGSIHNPLDDVEESMSLRADIIIEKLDKLIELLKEVRIAQSSPSYKQEEYIDNRPF
jgi:hypothetical protein